MRRLVVALALGLLAQGCGGGGGGGSGGGGATATQPVQPASGPGGAAATYAGVIESTYGTGTGQYWIFEPAGSGATPLPLVVFCHGYSAFQPDLYLAWIDHVVRRGAIVVYPRYQADLLTPPATFTSNALGAVVAAIAVLEGGGHAIVDLTHTAVVGHSFGGVIAANLAAIAQANGLPAFDAVMCCAPGTGGFSTYANYANIPAGTLLLSIACDDDTVVGDVDAKRIFNQTTSILEGLVCDGGASAGPCTPTTATNAPGGLPAPNVDADNVAGPETGLIVKFDSGVNQWLDTLGRDWSNVVRFNLPDRDVFAIDAAAAIPVATSSFQHVGTILFDMVQNPVNGKVYVTNTDANNAVRFEGPGLNGATTVGWDKNSTCFRFRIWWIPVCRCFHPKERFCDGCSRILCSRCRNHLATDVCRFRTSPKTSCTKPRGISRNSTTTCFTSEAKVARSFASSR